MRHVACVAAALALCAAAAATPSTAATRLARPPIDLAAAARSGIDLKAPVELVFEWRVSYLPSTVSVEAGTAALADAEDRIAPAVTFLMAASGLAFAGIGSAFWALAAGLAVRLVLRPRSPGATG